MAENFLTLKPAFFAILGGVLPSLLWLWFWLKQDIKNPEPKGLIALSFFAGMAIVYFVLPLQKIVMASMGPIMNLVDTISLKFTILPPDEQAVKVALLAFIEEFAKFATVFMIAFKTEFFDEPMDAVIYLITAALGFAAMENTLYILKDLPHGTMLQIFFDGNMRFLGATIVHIVSSAFIGIAIAFSFYAPRAVKFITIIVGIFVASLLHAYFNLSIMVSDGTVRTLLIFSQFWGAIIVIIMLLAVTKRLNRTVNTVSE